MNPSIWRLFHKACQQYNLLVDGDKVLIGLSGGKDSLLLTELLGRQAQIYKPRISVEAVHVRVKERNYLSDLTYLQSFCDTAMVPFTVLDTEITDPSHLGDLTAQRPPKDPCFLCSWYRRKALLNYAQEKGFNKIAFGHHQDDVLHTLLMNMIYEGRFTSIEPALKLDKMPLTLIRPLWLIKEELIRSYADEIGYHKQLKLCPYEHVTSRTDARKLLTRLEQLNPDVRSSLIHALNR